MPGPLLKVARADCNELSVFNFLKLEMNAVTGAVKLGSSLSFFFRQSNTCVSSSSSPDVLWGSIKLHLRNDIKVFTVQGV